MSIAAIERAGSSVTAFSSWLWKPSLPAVLGGFAVVVLFLTALLGTPDAVLRAALVRLPIDISDREPLHIFERATLMKQELGAGGAPMSVAIIGGSTLRESLYSEEYLATRMTEETGIAARVYDLTSSGQGMLTSLALAQTAACNGVKLVAVAANVGRFQKTGPIDPMSRIGFSSPAAERWRAKLAGEPASNGQGIYSWATTFRKFLRFRALLFKEAAYKARHQIVRLRAWRGNRHLYLMKQPLPDNERSAYLARVSISHSSSRLDEVYGMLRDIEAAVHACGGRTLLVIPPVVEDMLAPERYPAFVKASKEHRATLDQLISPSDAILNVTDYRRYRSAEVFDWGHLASEKAMVETTDIIARHLLDLALSSDRAVMPESQAGKP